MDMIRQYLRITGEIIQDPDPNAAPGVTTSTPPFLLGAKSEMSLIVACELMRYNVMWGPVIKSFMCPMEGLKEEQEGW